jgi:hypothetical protein
MATRISGKPFAFSFVVPSRAVLIAGALLAMGLAQSANAGTIYTYTGNDFTYFSGDTYPPWFPPSFPVIPPDALAVTFDVMAGTPLDNLTLGGPGSDVSADVVSFSFTDLSGLSAGSIYSLEIGTDASGNITNWSIEGRQDCPGLTCVILGTEFGPGLNSDVALVDIPNGAGGSNVNQAGNGGDPGTWTMSTTTPEPSTSFLLGTGLLGLLSLAARGKTPCTVGLSLSRVGNLQSPR